MSAWYALLPPLARFAGDRELQRRLLRADALPQALADEAGLASLFDFGADELPAAALLREHFKGDAGEHAWLCAEPACMEADMVSARVLACANMELDAQQAEAFVQTLQPLFAEEGMTLLAGLPGHWQVRLPPDMVVPVFDPPSALLGDDLLHHLPQGAEYRDWRRRLNEWQILLHQHPLNQQRRERGEPAVNSLWPWGGGRLPRNVSAHCDAVFGEDELLAALAGRAGLPCQPLASRDTQASRASRPLLDLRREPQAGAVLQGWLERMDRGEPGSLTLHFAGGERWRLRRAQRWRFWRRAR